MSMHLVILGAPGVGKGTQAKRIAKSLKLAHISTGDILRQQVRDRTELGLKVQNIIESGQLVSDELISQVVASRLQDEDCKTGYILDGYPRTQKQAQLLDDWYNQHNSKLDFAIDLEIGDEEVVQRLTARRVCSACNGIYNLNYAPPKIADTCDNPTCNGEKLIQRPDDQEATIRERLKVYHHGIEPLKAYYQKINKLQVITVDGLTPDNVFNNIETLIDSYKAINSELPTTETVPP